MNAAASLSWLYVLGGWPLGGSAAMLALWALFRDRGQKKRRCPRCWYDMSGTAGMRCPECGREAQNEKRLHRTRRRWRVVAPAALLGLIGYVVGSVPRYQSGGWVALVPSSVLVFVAPAEPASGGWVQAGLSGSGMSASPAAPVFTVGETMTNAVWNRLRGYGLTQWQSKQFIGRYLAKHNIDLFKSITLPRRWAVGEAIPAMFDQTSFEGMRLLARASDGEWVPTPSVRIAAVDSARETVSVELGLGAAPGRFYRLSREMPVVIQGTRETLLEHVDSEADNAMVKQALKPHVAMNGADPVIVLYDRDDEPAWKAIHFWLAYSFDVTLDGMVLLSGRGRMQLLSAARKNWEEFAVPEAAQAGVLSGRAVITIQGDWTEVTADYVSWPFDKPTASCWTGTISETLGMRAHPGIGQK